MPFQLDTMTEVRVLDVRTLASKDRKPDELPGAQLLLQATLPHGYLSMLDKTLPAWLYETATGAQSNLEGIEGADLTSLGEHLKRLSWAYEQTGNAVVIDHGMGGKSNIPLEDAKAYRLSFQPLKGGSVRVQWTLDIHGLSDTTRGKLSGLKATTVKLTMRAPLPDEDPQAEIGDDADPAPARKPAAAERAAVDKVKGVPDGTKASHKEAKPEPQPTDAWPFPKKDADKGAAPPQPVTIEQSQPGTRTARGMDKTKAAIEAGMAAHGGGAAS